MILRCLPRRRTAFTLAELLVVIAIIVLLVGILLPALGKVRRDAKDMATRSQLDAIGKANESYKIAFGAYAGPVDDQYWNNVGNRHKLTSTENLLLGLMGQVRANGSGNTAEIENYPTPLYVDLDQVGSGPMTNAFQTYGAFYPSKKGEVARVNGDAGDNANAQIPELVDVSYGLPILYFRARGGWQRPASVSYNDNGGGPPGYGAFSIAPVLDYTDATGLINPSVDPNRNYTQENSLLGSTGAGSLTNAVNNLAWMVINRKLSNLSAGNPVQNDVGDVPAGGFFLVATGYDRIYFDKDQVGGAIDNGDELSNFDDIIVSGGTAP